MVQEIQVPRRGASGKRLKFSSFAAREKRDAVERHLSQCIKAGDPIIIVLYCRYETGYAQVTVKCHLHFDGKGCSVGPKKHFTRVPYEQVFTTLADARTWASWHGELDIAEEPFHSKHVAQELTVEAAKQLQEGDVLASQKTLVLRALVLKDPEDFPHLVRTLSGPSRSDDAHLEGSQPHDPLAHERPCTLSRRLRPTLVWTRKLPDVSCCGIVVL